MFVIFIFGYLNFTWRLQLSQNQGHHLHQKHQAYWWHSEFGQEYMLYFHIHRIKVWNPL
jgi:hypothetical protein